jgi:hypothetical protein
LCDPGSLTHGDHLPFDLKGRGQSVIFRNESTEVVAVQARDGDVDVE